MGDGLRLPAIAVGLAVLVLLAVLAGSVLRGRKQRGVSVRQPDETGGPRFSAYLIEEEIPASESTAGRRAGSKSPVTPSGWTPTATCPS